MAANERIPISPSINFTETDLTFATRNFGLTSLGISGEFIKGKAFEPTFVRTYEEFRNNFGGLNPCTFRNSTQPKYEGAYIAKEFLQEADSVFVTRVLGLSGYDAGDTWSIYMGANVDEDTVIPIGTSGFSVSVRYVNNAIDRVEFSDPLLQDLYQDGLIPASTFGTSNSLTGTTIVMPNTYIGDCNTFSGARFEAVLYGIEENFLCITGSTVSGITVSTTGTTTNCSVIFDEDTLTTNSVFFIDVVNAVAIIDKITNQINVINSGVIKIVGGTITHANNNSLTVTNGTIYLPNGNVINGGIYNICDFASNTAFYDCNFIAGSGYTIVTGSTPTIIPQFVTGSSTVITQIPTGIETHYFSGTVVYLSGAPMEFYDERLVLTLRSNARYDGEDSLVFDVQGINGITIESLRPDGLIRPFDTFRLVINRFNAPPLDYPVSLNPASSNYIRKVLGSFVLCCENPSPVYVEEIYQSMINNLVADNKFYCIKPTLCYNQSLNNYKTEFKTPVTPFVVSELRGGKVLRLFRFYTLSDGEAANREIKISIENIRPDSKTFDVVVRSFNDTDATKIVLERFSGVTLDENSNRYIGAAIGTYNGTFVRRSRYIAIEVAAECVNDAFPAGFEGYPVRDYDCAKQPLIQYKKSYTSGDRVRNVYLGISNVVGFDQDMFDYKGIPNYGTEYWTGSTKGFHLDVDAAAALLEGTNIIVEFETGESEFKSEFGLRGTPYEPIFARKFTFVPYGGFDGWDIFRENRTNTDAYAKNGTKGVIGELSGTFSSYILPDRTEGNTSDYYAYLRGILTFSNKEQIRINLFTTPGIDTFNHSKLVEDTIEMITFDRGDTFYIVTTPDTDNGGGVITAADVSNSIDGLFDSSYTATYYPWGQYQDTENSRLLWLPPTAAVVKTMAITDKTRKVWFAPAGVARGATNFVQARTVVSLQDRDDAYAGRINPIMTNNYLQSNRTIFIWGNRTLQIGDSSLSDINVRRLVLYLRQTITDVGYNLLFEQNDREVRRQFLAILNPIFQSVQDERGIQRFRIELDSSEAGLASRELRGKIVIQPTRALEQINIGFILTDTQAEFDNV